VNAQRLRIAETPEELQKIQITKWYESMKRVTDAMREDMANTATNEHKRVRGLAKLWSLIFVE
jgi:hypothetical protein